MNNKKNKFKILINVVVFLVMFINLGLVKTVEGDTKEPSYYEPVERFGITAPLGFSGYDIESINVRAALNWQADSSYPLPPEVEFIHMLRVRNDLYSGVLASLPIIVPANLGEIWIVGNEPDTTYEDQDNVYAEVYAARYYEIATTIRGLDPSAKLVFGSIVQPTPVRLHYLEHAVNELVILSGSRESALALIDIWSIHAFILNEGGGWGTGLPLGCDPVPGSIDYCGDPLIITNLSDTYSIVLFTAGVIRFRNWMNSIGEREKPLWITEYGSLIPPIDLPEPPNYATVSDENTTAYMIDTFDFMLSAISDTTGFPPDDNHLVQRWFWYSLNDHRYSFGGSLFDPDNDKAITIVGEAFKAYTNRLIPKFVFLPIVYR